MVTSLFHPNILRTVNNGIENYIRLMYQNTTVLRMKGSMIPSDPFSNECSPLTTPLPPLPSRPVITD